MNGKEPEPRRRRGRPTKEEAERRKRGAARVAKHRERKKEEQMSEEAELLARVPDPTDSISDSALSALNQEEQILQLNYSTAKRLGIPFYVPNETTDTRNARLELAALRADGFESKTDYELYVARQRVAVARPSRSVQPPKPREAGMTDDKMAEIIKDREKQKADLLSYMVETDNAPTWLTEQFEEEK
jgi:hypothetical protein